MGYRAYLGKIKKSSLDEIRSFSDIDSLNKHFRKDDPLTRGGVERFFEIDHADQSFTTTLENLYSFEDEDEEAYIITKEQFVHLIDLEREKVAEYYAMLIDDNDNEVTADNTSIKSLLRTKKNTWSKEGLMSGYELDSPVMTLSWLREYCIFNLVHVYKTMDWETECLVYTAY